MAQNNAINNVPTTTPTALIIPLWDSNLNLTANNYLSGYTTTATAAATTTLTVASTFQQFFTGSTTQTVLLPVTSTLALGQSFLIVNNSSGVVTVQSSGANTIQALAAGTSLLVTCILTSGTTAASWSAQYTTGTFPLSKALGGTGVSTPTTSPTANAYSAWDANSNLSANNLLAGYATTATAAGTTTLTVGSAQQQLFTGSTTQTVVLPVTSTLVLGQSFLIVNNSSGVVTVQSSGANTIQAMAAGTALVVTCILTSGTTAASWNAQYLPLALPLAKTLGGTGVSSPTTSPAANAYAAWDANSNISANNLLEGYTTTATAAALTTLTVASTFQQFFTGTTTQTVKMPVTSTLALGQSFLIVNNSTGVVTVESSGANTIQAMASGTTAIYTCILTSGTTAASWSVTYIAVGSSGTVTSVATSGLATGGTITTSGTITVTAATQAQQEAATSNSVAVTPANQGYHPTAVTAWASVTGTTINSAYNISSVTNSGAVSYVYTCAFTNAMTDTNYATLATAFSNSGAINPTITAVCYAFSTSAASVEFVVNGAAATVPGFSVMTLGI